MHKWNDYINSMPIEDILDVMKEIGADFNTLDIETSSDVFRDMVLHPDFYKPSTFSLLIFEKTTVKKHLVNIMTIKNSNTGEKHTIRPLSL